MIAQDAPIPGGKQSHCTIRTLNRIRALFETQFPRTLRAASGDLRGSIQLRLLGIPAAGNGKAEDEKCLSEEGVGLKEGNMQRRGLPSSAAESSNHHLVSSLEEDCNKGVLGLYSEISYADASIIALHT
jgi:hypothetical protein